MEKILLGLGSNRSWKGLGPLDLLEEGKKALASLFIDFKVSSVYRTKAMYVEDQEDFYNAVILGTVKDGLSPHDFLDEIHKIEASFGRDRSKEIRFGPRSLDIDIELWGRKKINLPDLVIPHPRLLERAFVLVPLSEILKDDDSLLVSPSEVEAALSKIDCSGVTKI